MSQPQDRAIKQLATFIQSIQFRLKSGLLTPNHGKRTHMEHYFVTFIQSIQFRLKSGLLTPNHGKRTHREVGSIAFVNGQATPANEGHYVGSEAFKQLNPWETGQFSFVTRPSSPIPSSKTIYTYMAEKSPIASKPDTLRNTRPFAHELDRRTNSTQTRPLSPFSPTSTQKHLNLKETKVPQPTRSCSAALQLMESMGFSRTHRRLFLLIDGNRSINELARLIGRTPKEVSELLRDLKDAYLF